MKRVRKLRSIICGTGVASLMLPAFAHAASKLVCESLFVSSLPRRTHATVKIAGTARNGLNEEFYILRRTPEETSWSSIYAPLGYDRQGSALAPYMILGHDLATVLGFHENDRGELLVPVPRTFDMRLARFNQFLKARGLQMIRISLYEQPQPTILSYLKQWAERTAIPVAAGRTNHTVHDISYHYSNILLPNAVAHILQIQAMIASSWIVFNGLDSTSLAARAIVGKIDILSTSANFMVGQVGKKNLAMQISEALDIKIAADARMSPFLTLEHAQAMSDYLHATSPLEFFEAIVKRYERVPTENFKRWAAQTHPEWSLTFAELELKDANQIHELYETRAKEVRAAAREFLKNPAFLRFHEAP